MSDDAEEKSPDVRCVVLVALLDDGRIVTLPYAGNPPGNEVFVLQVKTAVERYARDCLITVS